MADSFRFLHQLRRFAEIGVGAGGIDHRVCFALAYNGTGIDCVTHFARHWKRFARQCRLIHLNRVTIQQARIRRYNVAQAHSYDIARHEQARQGIHPLPVAFNGCFDRKLGLQRCDGVTCLMFFPETDYCVGEEQYQNNAEVRPMPSNRG